MPNRNKKKGPVKWEPETSWIRGFEDAYEQHSFHKNDIFLDLYETADYINQLEEFIKGIAYTLDSEGLVGYDKTIKIIKE